MDERPAVEHGTAASAQRRRRYARAHGAAPRRGTRAHTALNGSNSLERYDRARADLLGVIARLEPLLEGERRAGLADAARQLEKARFVLAVVGEFSSGKSFLLNALLGTYRFEQVGGREQITGLLATDINPSTAAITELEYAPASEAHAIHESGRTERIPLDRLGRFIAVASSTEAGAMHGATTEEADPPVRVVVKTDSPFLARGFSVADTPGLASVNPAHRRATLRFLPSADAVLYLIDTQQPFTEGDASFLEIIRRHLDTVFIVQTKIDLWQNEQGGRPAWEAARERILTLAAVHAPGALVQAVSARQYVEGQLRGDETLVERSQFPQLLAALDTSLVRNTGMARLRRASENARRWASEELRRLERDAAMLSLPQSSLQAEAASLQPQMEQLRAFVRATNEHVLAAAQRLHDAVQERGEGLAADARQALARAFDSADVARLRDRARLHAIVDRTLGQVVDVFADEIASAVTAEYDRALAQTRDRIDVQFSFAQAAAAEFGSAGGSSAWDEDPRRALSAAIALEAIGGPAIALAAEISQRFAAVPPGSYMKRELTSDLRAVIWPRFDEQMRAFANGVAGRLNGLAQQFCAALESALKDARDAALGSVERALAADRSGERGAVAIAAVQRRREAISALLAQLAEHDSSGPSRTHDAQLQSSGNPVRRAHVEVEFDREAYRMGLRPQRWRVAILGALRRGKSSLINAFAGGRVLADETAGAIAYPVHVRYGDDQAAFALEPGARWREIEVESALDEAARNPVLILTPWKLPRELVLVHAPAFDAGDPMLEDVCTVAAREASEVLCLFSRQLSERELALYHRIADLGKPMFFVHTLADNESPAERRGVVDLAAQYLRERNIPAARIFTVSTLEYTQARREHRAPAGWNEIDALISTIAAHAEEHMARLQRLERAATVPAPAPQQAPVPPSTSLFGRLFRR